MLDIVYAARRLVDSNLGWFLKTRSTILESSGRERAININREVMDEFFPDEVSDTIPIEIKTRYIDGNNGSIVVDERTIRKQGGDKNWRMAGNAIPGDFYDVRNGDIMVMAFEKSSRTLSFIVVRHGKDLSRNISQNEIQTHKLVESILGEDSRNMWLPSHQTASEIISHVKVLNPLYSEILMEDKAMIESFREALQSIGFVDSNDICKRLILSLKAKRFAILTGLSGSGKTLIARSLARWLSSIPDQYCIISVGSNWTSNESIVGYPDALDHTRYEKTKALELLLKANEESHREKPFFLILDEMNLSHVERYFSDFLSWIEAVNEPLRLHHDSESRNGVPPFIKNLPDNLFIIGTVNVDETTYMFSPKVLDRANTLEFKASIDSIDAFIKNPIKPNPEVIEGKGSLYGKNIIDASIRKVEPKDLSERLQGVLAAEIKILFDIMSEHESEFGYRTIHEILRYVYFESCLYSSMDESTENTLIREAIDAQILQKILPKLHGSRKRLEPVLRDLNVICHIPHIWGNGLIENIDELKAYVIRARENDDTLVLSDIPFFNLCCDKINRMLSRLETNGFTSFAEN